MKINKLELQKALEKVKPGLARSEFIEQTTSFAFTGGNVVTYNDEISISHPVENLDVTGAVKAQTLYELLNRIKDEEIDIDWEDNQVIIKAGKSKAGLVFEQEVVLPVEEEIGEIKGWKKLPEDFIKALKFCYPCCSRDMSRPVLTCVNVTEKRIEASDSYQIITFDLSDKIPVEPFLIPVSAIRELVKYDIKEVSKGESWIHFRTEDGTVFSSRIFMGEFPNIDAHLEVSGKEFDFPKNTREILERADVFSKKGASHDDIIPAVEIEIKKKLMHVSAKNEHGWFKERARVKYADDPVAFEVGIDFLLDIADKFWNCVIGENAIKFEGDNWVHVIATLGSGDGE